MSKNTQKLNTETPADKAAKLVIGERVRIARKHLRGVCGKKRDSEDVHQLRVATRRLGVALSIFKSILRKKPRRELGKAAEKLRRACGDVRDADVLNDVLKSHVQNGEGVTEATKAVGESLGKTRKRAYRALDEEIVESKARFEQAAKDLLDEFTRTGAVDPDAGRAPFRSIADRAVRRGLHEFTSAASGELEHLDQMHVLRIAAKHLRYAMEATECCYPPAFGGELYHGVESVQSRLGHVNDLRNLIAVAAEVAEKRKKGKSRTPRTKADFRALLEGWTAALGDAQREFLESFRGGEREALNAAFRAVLDGAPIILAERPAPEKVDLCSRSIELPNGADSLESADTGAPHVNNV